MEQGLYQSQKQMQILAPRMIQSMEILQLPLLSLVERLQSELQENPVLELRDPANEEPGAETDFKGSDSLEPEKPRDENDELVVDSGSAELDFDRLDALSRDYGDFLNEEHRPSRSGLDEEGDKKHDAMQNMADRPKSLQDHLEEQVGFLDVSPDAARLVHHVISYVDQTGYLGLRVLVRRDEDLGDALLITPAQQRVLTHVLDFVEKSGHSGLRIVVREEPREEDKASRKREKDKELFVPVTLEAIAESYDRPVTVEQVEEALATVQKLDPPGVGARDLRECLLVQITDETPHSEVVRTLVRDHLEDIQHNRLPHIQKVTHYDLDTINEGIEALRHLNPRPGAQFEANTNRYIVPDIEVSLKEDGTYGIKLLDDWIPDVHLSRRYVEMAKDRSADKKTREFLKRKIQDALWLKESIEQRRNTLEKVTRAIVEHQKDFLDHGPEHIKPLKMQQIAERVGVHVTTVSRAVDDKYVQTPRGVFPLKRFFGGAAKNEQTNEDIVAWERIKQKLLELIGKEDKTNPLSDEELVDRLEAEGFPVARRTVTKYRKMLDIPSSRQRKDWTLIESESRLAAPSLDGANGHHPAEPSEDGELHAPPAEEGELQAAHAAAAPSVLADGEAVE